MRQLNWPLSGSCRSRFPGRAIEAPLVRAQWRGAAVGEAVAQRGGHLGITKDRGPFAEAEVGRDRHAGALVELAQQMEQQCAARGAERQVTVFSF